MPVPVNSPAFNQALSQYVPVVDSNGQNGMVPYASPLITALARAQLSNPEISGLYSPAPTVTSNTTGDGTLTQNCIPDANFTKKVAVTGGRFYYGSNGRGYVATQNVFGDAGNLTGITNPVPTPPSGENCIGPYYYRFITDEPKPQIQAVAFTASKNVRALVDGKLIDATGWDMVTNNQLQIDFGSRASEGRLIELECQGNIALFNIKIGPTSRLWKPIPLMPVRAAICGDSHTEGLSGMTNTPFLGTSAILARMLGIWDMRIYSVGSTGYVHTGSSGLRNPIRAQMRQWIDDGSYDLIIFCAGYNDIGYPTATVQAEALRAWQAARISQPHARIIVTGVWAGAQGPSASQTTLETALLATFNAWGDSYSKFIPISTAIQAWISGTGFAGSTTGSGNADNCVSADGIHNLAYGQAYFAQRLADELRNDIFNYGR